MIASLAITNSGSANTSAGDVSIKSSPQFSDSSQQDGMNASSFELKDSHELNNSRELDNSREPNNSHELEKSPELSKSTEPNKHQAVDKKDKASTSSQNQMANEDNSFDGNNPLSANGQPQQNTKTTYAQIPTTMEGQLPDGQVAQAPFNETQFGATLTQAQQLSQEADTKALNASNMPQGPHSATPANMTPQQALAANLLQQGKSNQSTHSNTVAHGVNVNNSMQLNGAALTTSSLATDSELALNNIQSSHLRQANGFMPAGAFAFNADNIENALSQLGQGGNNVVDEAAQLISQHGRTQAKVSQWGPISLPQSAPLAQQAQELLSPLREQLRFQVDQQIKHAEVRLDPPELGKIDLNIRLDGDKLHIQMNAANTSVRDALQLSIERLRDDLAMDHGGQIDVDISQGEQKEQNDNPTRVASIASSLGESMEPQHTSQQHLAQNQVDLLA
ncbi:flagellar hook-length control protein FliK [uncultured Shewanella sp.]|uniref:flagellar hook-length control protein FliK n=1 Tax=uncultured Shewanella sp. TaxID=173975 RepID=UPI002601FC15|nr:flagellar hook-length control protein FliK [uncultured Shewanella sp.]